MKVFKNVLIDVENDDGPTTYSLTKLYVAENKRELNQITEWHQRNGFEKDFEGIISNSDVLELISKFLVSLINRKIIIFKKKNNFGIVQNFDEK
ncbi:MAG: hypothetical protein ACTSSP_06200 [Candidatus Asgardarchaeia archaeon]|nr:hypothetical protein [Candidatus Odinarchaeota archaeon]